MALNSMFKTGYKAVEDREKEVEESSERAKRGYLPNFYIDSGESKEVRILTQEPLTYYEHYMPTNPKGKQFQMCTATATDAMGKEIGCKYCDMGNKPSFKGAFLIIDHTEDSWEDKEGKTKVSKDTIKVMKLGLRALRVLGNLSKKRDLTKMMVEVSRSGKGTETAYNFVPDVPSELSSEITTKITEFLGGVDAVERLAEFLVPFETPEAETKVTDAKVVNPDEVMEFPR
jgi:hypothetical protein